MAAQLTPSGPLLAPLPLGGKMRESVDARRLQPQRGGVAGQLQIASSAGDAHGAFPVDRAP